MEEMLWFETRSGKYPYDCVAVIHFRWVAMKRDISDFEVDNMRMVYCLKGTRDDLRDYLLKKGEGVIGI